MELIGEGEALSAYRLALADIEAVKKGEVADMGKYEIRYASLNAVLAECVRVCQLHGLEVTQEPGMHEGMFAVFTTLLHSDGSRVEFRPLCLPMPKDAQALGSATTYLRRYGLTAAFRIPVEDDDGKAATVAAHVEPGRRTEAERMIRELMLHLDAGPKKALQSDFKDQFHSSLADLPAAKHGEALTWTRDWIAAWADTVK